MSASFFSGESARRIIFATVLVLLSASTSAFKNFPPVRITGRGGAAASIGNCLQTDKLSPIRGYLPLYSTPIIETSIDESNGNNTTTSITPNIVTPALGFFAKVKSVLSGNGLGKFPIKKESLTKLGMNVLLAYGFVSNASYITCLILAWVTHGKSTGLSPLVPGQWKKFLLVYAGFFAANNVLRPLRFSLSIAITPAFDKFIDFVEKKTSWGRKYCTATVIFIVNICGPFAYLFAGLFVATTLANVPLLP